MVDFTVGYAGRLIMEVMDFNEERHKENEYRWAGDA